MVSVPSKVSHSRHKRSVNKWTFRFVLASFAIATSLVATSWLNVAFNDLPSLGPNRTFGYHQELIKNCSLPCAHDTNVWTGQFLNYDPCPIEPGFPEGCRVTSAIYFYHGDANFVEQYKNSAIPASYFNVDEDGTPMKIKELEQWGDPMVYADIPMAPESATQLRKAGIVEFITGDYDSGALEYSPFCFVASSWGQVCMTVTYCNLDYQLNPDNGQPEQYELLNARGWDIIQGDAWLTKEATRIGSIFFERLDLSKKILAGHSIGGGLAAVFASVTARARFGLIEIAGIVALVLPDPSYWILNPNEIAENNLPAMIMGSSELDPIMGNRRGLAFQSNPHIYVVMINNSAHQQIEYGAMKAAMHARLNALNNSADTLSWSGDETSELLYPTAVANEDATGIKFPSDTVIQTPMLGHFEVYMHFFGVFINIYQLNNPLAKAELTFHNAQTYLAGRGQFWAHYSCGSETFQAPASIWELLGVYDTYEPNAVTVFVNNYIAAAPGFANGTFSYSKYQQTALQLEECLISQGKHSEAAFVAEQQLFLQKAPAPKENPHTMGTTRHKHVLGLKKPLKFAKEDLYVKMEKLDKTFRRMLHKNILERDHSAVPQFGIATSRIPKKRDVSSTISIASISK